jgi:hypothetical protein
LWAAQRNDVPITVRSGYSVAELILSPDPVDYAGIVRPEGLVVLSDDGLKKAQRYLAVMNEESRVFALPPFADVTTRAAVTVIDPSKGPTRVAKGDVALAALEAVVRETGLVPLEALDESRRAGE